MNFLDPDKVLRLILLIINFQVVISSLEALVNIKIYRPGQLFSWVYIKRANKLLTLNPLFEKTFNTLFDYPNIIFFTAIKLSLSILLVIFLCTGKPIHLLVLTITIMSVLTGLRNTYGTDGSDQLTNIIMLTICIAMLPGLSGSGKTIAICFIAFQAELSYVTSGAYKFISPGWKNGDYLRDILSTASYGNKYAKKFFDSIPISYIIGSFCIIFGELLFGLCFLFPPDLCLVTLAIGILFHFSVALIMGLNTFLWAFVSTYPAIYFITLLHASGFNIPK
jgi:hypothetical protein